MMNRIAPGTDPEGGSSCDHPPFPTGWRLAAVWGGLVVLLLGAVAAGIGVGSVALSPRDVMEVILAKVAGTAGEVDPAVGAIVWEIRFPRLALALLVGGMLAAVGTALQGLLRNPLADPYIIGTSAGAALGAVIGFLLGMERGWQSILFLPASATVGALLLMGAVFAIARRAGGLSIEVFLLTGVVAGSFVWSLVTFLLTLLRENVTKILFWLMGALAEKGWGHVAIVAPYALIGLPLLIGHAYSLNLLSLGEEKAGRLGVDVERTKRFLLVLSVVLTAAAVAVAGIIGFLGLLVPHAARLLVGPDHRILLPVAIVGGGAFLALSDGVARMVVAPGEIPVGVVTALLGAPFFCYLLWRARPDPGHPKGHARGRE